MWVLYQGDVRNEASCMGVAGRSEENDARSKLKSMSIVAVCFLMEVTWTGQPSWTVATSSL